MAVACVCLCMGHISPLLFGGNILFRSRVTVEEIIFIFGTNIWRISSTPVQTHATVYKCRFLNIKFTMLSHVRFGDRTSMQTVVNYHFGRFPFLVVINSDLLYRMTWTSRVFFPFWLCRREFSGMLWAFTFSDPLNLDTVLKSQLDSLDMVNTNANFISVDFFANVYRPFGQMNPRPSHMNKMLNCAVIFLFLFFLNVKAILHK